MKKLFLLLLVGNLGLFAYAYFERMNSSASANANRYKPLNPDQVKVLSVQQMARLGPAKVAQLTLACAEWGPFSETDRTKALRLMEPLALGRTLSSRRTDVAAGHWAYIPPKQSKVAAERALAEIKKLGVEDAAIILEPGQWNNAISLGVFRTKDAADARLAAVKAKGVKTAIYRQREQLIAMTMLILREPAQATLLKLDELKIQIVGSSVTTGACPESRN